MIRSFNHYAFSVPDPEIGRQFFEDFGLEAVDHSDRLSFRCAGRGLDQVVLLPGSSKKQLHHLSFGTGTDELPELRARLEASGVDLLDPPYDGAASGIWFLDPECNLVNVSPGGPPLPRAVQLPDFNGPSRIERRAVMGCPERGRSVSPTRLMHCIIFSRDTNRLSDFYINVLGMRLSDTVGGDFARFLRTSGDSDHHVLGILKSESRGFHHACFEVESIDMLVLGAQAMVGSGHRHVWGLGRHVVGSNLFQYFRDPWGSMTEYSIDIDFIPEDAEWRPRDWGKDGMFLWATDGPPPSDFAQNYEID